MSILDSIAGMFRGAEPVARTEPTPISAGFHGDTIYDAASSKNGMRNWNPSMGSADSDFNYEADVIRGRARDADRNQPLGNATVSTMVYNVVGKGLTPIPDPNYRALGKSKEWADEWKIIVQAEAESYFNSTDVDATGMDDFGHMTAQVFQSDLVNGGIIEIPLWREDIAPHRATDYRTTMQLVEIDRLCNPNDEMDSEFMRKGVEIDKNGEPVAYHILKTHPGDIFLGSTAFNREWERIPAWTPWGRQRVLHVFNRERVGANRGEPLLSGVLSEYKDIDTAMKAELDAVVANAFVALVAESPIPGDMIKEIFGTVDNYMALRGQFKARPKPGMIAGLFPGDKLSSFTSSRPNVNFGPFIDYLARGSAAATGQPLEMVRREYAKMNYSSMRGMMVDAARTYSTFGSRLKRRHCTPIYQLWFEDAVDLGRVPDVDLNGLYENWSAWTGVDWMGEGEGWVDPVKEADAAHNRVVYGFSSLKDENASKGKDWRKVADQRATERDYYVNVLKMNYPGDEAPTVAPIVQVPEAVEEEENANV